MEILETHNRNGPDTFTESLTIQILAIWPELTDKFNDACLIYTGFHPEFSFNTRSTQGLKDQIDQAYNTGKRYIMFECLGEGISSDVISKIHLVTSDLVAADPSVTVYYFTGVLNGEEAYINICNKLNLQSYITVMSCSYLEYIHHSSYPIIDEYEIRTRKKNYLCLNKVHRQHRIDLLELMLSENLINDKCYYSFQDYSQSTDDILISLLDEHYPNIKSNLDFIKTLQLNFDPTRTNPVNIIQGDLELYHNSYFSVITETIYYDSEYTFPKTRCHVSPVESSIFITEKTIKCLALKHPFVVASVSGMLEGLRKRGYKTFHPFIDETYDTILDDDLRLQAIVQEVNRLSSQSDADWLEWTANIKDIVEYNHTHFFNQLDFRA
jgi:hypothetical protein